MTGTAPIEPFRTAVPKGAQAPSPGNGHYEAPVPEASTPVRAKKAAKAELGTILSEVLSDLKSKDTEPLLKMVDYLNGLAGPSRKRVLATLARIYE